MRLQSDATTATAADYFRKRPAHSRRRLHRCHRPRPRHRRRKPPGHRRAARAQIHGEPRRSEAHIQKLGHKGIYLESPRQGAETWEFLAIDIESPYLDTRPNLIAGQAEWRDYRARYWDGTPVGDWSAVLRVSVG